MNSLKKGMTAVGRFFAGRAFVMAVLFGVIALAACQAMTATVVAADDVFSVHVVADGETSTILMDASDTVSDALYKAEVFVELDDVLKLNDKTNPKVSTLLQEDDVITVQRVEYEVWTEEEAIPHDIKTTPSGDLERGVRKVTKKGSNGKVIRTYEIKLVDGDVVEEKILDEYIESKPVTQEVTLGMGSNAVSSFNFEYDFDENCEPIGYKSVIRNTKAASYSAPAGSKTASGRDAIVGHVAVDPKVIPYGSKLFIQSADGSFIYGYAIAADTGTSLKQGVIGVDLFYSSYADCVRNGMKYVDIYILE